MHPLVANVLRWHSWLAKALFGFTPRFLSGFRTHEQQLALFRGDVPTPNPVAFPGTSQHEFGFAYDLAPDVQPGHSEYRQKLEQLSQLGLALGMHWGGQTDPQHWQVFERLVWQQIVGATAPRQGVA